MIKPSVAIHWFRRDLRLTDNAALYHALKENEAVVPIFIFDKNILDKLEDKADKRLIFIHEAVKKLQQQLQEMGSNLLVIYDTPLNAWQQLMEKYTITAAYANTDYEQYAMDRDATVGKLLQGAGATLHTYKDQVIFEKDEVVKDDGLPYTVFTPYSKKWKAKWNNFYTKAYPTEQYYSNFFKSEISSIPSLQEMGFVQLEVKFPPINVSDEVIKKYKDQRDYPAVIGTSRLGVHLRFGTISIRQLAAHTAEISEGYLNELIWRDFYHMILWHFPRVRQGLTFRPAYEHIQWRNNEAEFAAWCNGQTGYPIVDAGMRELNETGYMHNRVRMIVASFLTKHLLIDWRWGELYFAKKLLDFDYAANNGGWQWAAGSGCDAAPYFRVFNPTLQTEKFDKQGHYIRKWVPEFEGFNYIAPIVVHEVARKRALEVYGKALKGEG